MADLFNISVSGLKTLQTMLATTNHNIANVNTEGYSRQKVDLTTREPSYAGVGYIGSGVRATAIKREFDQFINNQVVANTGLHSQVNELYSLLAQLDNLVADPDAGLSPAVQDFFNATQDVADDPSSVPARQLLLGSANTLISRFEHLDQRIADLSRDANATLQQSVSEVNSIASSIADLNKRITIALGEPDRQPVNDLLDQRQQLVVELSKHISVSTLEQNDGTLNVFIGTGQTLVSGFVNQTLSTGPNEYDATLTDVFVTTGNSSVNVTAQVSGGEMGAANSFIQNTLVPARNAMGRIALGLADNVNAQHRLGMDLDGILGGDFFKPINSTGFGVTVNDSTNNSGAGVGVVGSSIVDVGNLTTSDYTLVYNGANSFTLTRLSDNTQTAINAVGYPYTYPPGAGAEIDGFNITIASAPTAGDSWKISPTSNGLRGMDMAISDTAKIAAANPVRGETSLANIGSGVIGDTSITDAAAYVADTYTITFTAANTYEVRDSGAALVAGPAAYTAGSPITFNGIQTSVSGTPVAGDTFTVSQNTSGVGDNRNMLSIASLQAQQTLAGGNASYLDAYGELVADIGTQTRQTELTRDAQEVLLEQAINQREEKSGVNLDEEAANLVRFQQAYQAIAQVVSVANDIFQTILGVIGR
jgi:flagellar hook-associated protein 1 FlgK